MTCFIQTWPAKRLPEGVESRILVYSGEDVVFVPDDTEQIFKINGNIKKKCRIEEKVSGFNYELTPGTLFLGEKLEVVLESKF